MWRAAVRVSAFSFLVVAAIVLVESSEAGEAGPNSPDAAVNDLCAGALPLACGETINVDLRLFTQSGDPAHPCRSGGAGGSNSAWYRIVPPTGTTSVRIHSCATAGPPADSVMTLWSGTCGALTQVACSDDACGTGDAYLSDICVAGLTPGETYWLEVGAWQTSDAGIYTITVECPCPDFTLGACCTVDGASCEEGVLGVACFYSGRLFHSGLTCAEVNCMALCQPGDQAEGEPFCSDPDTFNSSCQDPPIILPGYECGDVICGEYWADGGVRDTDWHAFDLTVESRVTWRVRGTATTLVFIIALGPDPLDPCTGTTTVATDTAPPFEAAMASACLAPGRYYLWAGTQDFTGTPCVGRYRAEIVCDSCPTGACCLEAGCQEGLSVASCAAAGGVYQGDGSQCATTDCLGACCLADGNCASMTGAACTAANGIFNGQGTRCNDPGLSCTGACCLCPAECTITTEQACRAAVGFFQGNGTTCADANNCAALPEGETVCTPGSDNFNGGCNSTPNVFSSIACGQTVCGRSANPSGAGPRDTDWYRFTLLTSTRVRWEVVGNTRMQANLLRLTGSGCPVAGNVVSDVSDAPFEAAVAEATLAPGTYVAYAAVPLSVSPSVPCGANTYRGTLTCRAECPAVCGDSNCDGVVNILDINFFVAAVQGEAAWSALHGGSPTCSYCCSNDTNGDGVVNILDINSFVAAVSSGGCTNSTNCAP